MTRGDHDPQTISAPFTGAENVFRDTLHARVQPHCFNHGRAQNARPRIVPSGFCLCMCVFHERNDHMKDKYKTILLNPSSSPRTILPSFLLQLFFCKTFLHPSCSTLSLLLGRKSHHFCNSPVRARMVATQLTLSKQMFELIFA